MQLNMAQIIEIILIAALIGITAWYTKQTKRQAGLLSEQRRTSIKPLLQIDTASIMRNHLNVKTKIKEYGPTLPPYVRS